MCVCCIQMNGAVQGGSSAARGQHHGGKPTLKDLRAEDKKRVANLIRELAR